MIIIVYIFIGIWLAYGIANILIGLVQLVCGVIGMALALVVIIVAFILSPVEWIIRALLRTMANAFFSKAGRAK